MTQLDFESKKINIKTALYQACRNGELEEVKFLLTSSELEYKPSANEDNEAPLFNALNYGNYEIAKYLLTSTELKVHADKYLAFNMACENNALELVKFLFDNLQFEINIHQNNDFAFEQALSNESYEVLDYFIFDKNIEITQSIKNILNENPNEKVNSWIEKRQVNIDLNKNLPKNKIREKNLKL